MGRRKRAQSDEYDDSVERRFFEKQNGKDDGQQKPKELSAEDIEKQQLKKKAKKLRQKEKKLVAKKAEHELRRAEKKEKEEMKELKVQKQKQKEIEKKQPVTHEFIKTHKDVKYCDLLLGKGPEIEERKKAKVKYVLRAKDKKGKVIDSGGNFGFKMGKGEVIEGWEIGMKGMKQGGIRHIIVPPKAGYGTKDIGGGAGAILYFEVTLLSC